MPRRKVSDEMSECTSCGEYFGTSDECPLCGYATVPISKGIEVFEDFEDEAEDGGYSSPRLAYGEALASDINLDNEEYLAEAV
ncbi:MAG: hypothetical protein AAB881_00040 [Patescibacteria group bacterium]